MMVADRLPAGPLARVKLAALPTPLAAAPRLAAALGVEDLLVKRDDLTGFAIGGNKARSLEFLIAAARQQDADMLVTGGTARSNFCAAAAAAARWAGLGCQLVIAGEPSQRSAGLDLARAWGASIGWTRAAEPASVDDALPRVAADLAARGRRPYLVPRGGATALGAAGYALAASELHEQLTGRGPSRTCVVVAVGSGCTLAGLLAGNALLGWPWRLVGASVSRPPQETTLRVLGLARACLALLDGVHRNGRDPTGPNGGVGQAAPAIADRDVELVDARGPGHGAASPEGRRAAETAMRTEGLVLDPVYTAKALPVVRHVADQPVIVFWHTGGMLAAIAAAMDQAAMPGRPRPAAPAAGDPGRALPAEPGAGDAL